MRHFFLLFLVWPHFSALKDVQQSLTDEPVFQHIPLTLLRCAPQSYCCTKRYQKHNVRSHIPNWHMLTHRTLQTPTKCLASRWGTHSWAPGDTVAWFPSFFRKVINSSCRRKSAAVKVFLQKKPFWESANGLWIRTWPKNACLFLKTNNSDTWILRCSHWWTVLWD